MKSVQRKFGGMMKRSADDQDVGAVLAEFAAVNEMLDKLHKDLKLYRDQWEDILKYQFDMASALADLYKPIEPTTYAEQRHRPAETPQKYMQKSLTLQKSLQDLRDELNQELTYISTKCIYPVEHAKLQIKPLDKTLKHRENMKRDHERYLGRAEHARKKELRSAKEETVLAQHESNLAQSRIDYETADDQVRTTIPPVSAAVKAMLPLILASQVMIETTIVGQIYTILDGWCRRIGLPSPAPSDDVIIGDWDREYTGLRQEMESGLKVIRTGKAVNQSMALAPDKAGGTVSGLGIRNKVMGRKTSDTNLPERPVITSGPSTNTYPALPAPGAGGQPYYGDEEEDAPPKPPRPGFSGGSSYGSPPPSISLNNKPQIPSNTKPRIPSGMSTPNPGFSQRPSFSEKIPAASPGALTPGYPGAPPPYQGNGHAVGGATPPSRYGTPLNGRSSPAGYPPSPGPGNGLVPTTSQTFAGSSDYFAQQRRASQASQLSLQSHASLASSAASIAAGKKKAPPPVPKPKRLASFQDIYVMAVFDFQGQNPGDLAFREGDRIKVVKKTDSQDDWWDGELHGQLGTFPANYVKL